MEPHILAFVTPSFNRDFSLLARISFAATVDRIYALAHRHPPTDT